jgi:hypothetical protein
MVNGEWVVHILINPPSPLLLIAHYSLFIIALSLPISASSSLLHHSSLIAHYSLLSGKK